jgi:hypothetical protein
MVLANRSLCIPMGSSLFSHFESVVLSTWSSLANSSWVSSMCFRRNRSSSPSSRYGFRTMATARVHQLIDAKQDRVNIAALPTLDEPNVMENDAPQATLVKLVIAARDPRLRSAVAASSCPLHGRFPLASTENTVTMLPKLALGFSPLSRLRLLKRIAAPPFRQTVPPIAPNCALDAAGTIA